MQFKTSHLFLATLLTAIVLSMIFYRTPPQFNHPDVEPAIGNTLPGWKPLEVIGDENGPFRTSGVFRFGLVHSEVKSSVTYVIDGEVKEFTLPKTFEGYHAKASFFKNRRGNHLCILYVETKE